MATTVLTAKDGRDARDLWDLDASFRHLNHGSFGAVPTAALEHQAQHRLAMEKNPVRWFSTLVPRLEGLRADVAERLATPAEDLVLVANASAGVSVVFRAVAQGAPVHVVVTDHGYGAVTMGAERVARETGGTLTTLRVPLDATDVDVLQIFADHLGSHQTDLVVVDQVTSATARQFPAAEIARLARRHGALVLVDGAHAPGALADPVVREADVWVGNLHKFWCAPRGTAVLVRNNPDLDLFPLVDSWGGHEPFPARFDHQGTVDVTSWCSAAFTYDHLEQQLGWDAIRDHGAAMMQHAEQQLGAALRDLGVQDPVADVGHAFGPMLLFRLPGQRVWDHAGVDALRVPFMEATGCIGAFTEFHGEGFLRVSAAPYTTEEDIDEMASTALPILAEIIGRRPSERTSR